MTNREAYDNMWDELEQYREIGTVEQVRNQKENLNIAYKIISDYESCGTIEDFKEAQRYMRLVKAHGTIRQVIDSCAEYEEIGTVEQCREARRKQIPMKPITYTGTNRADCPVCGAMVRGLWDPLGDFCSKCGQAIQWENLEGATW